MRLLWRDQWKKIMQKPFYLLSISSIVLVIIVSFVSIHMTIHRLESNVETFLEDQQVEDFNILLGQIDFNLLTGQQRLAVCATFPPIVCHGIDETDPVQMNEMTRIIQAAVYTNPGLYDIIFDPMMDPLIELYGFEFEKIISMNIEYQGHQFRFLSINERINIPFVHEGRLPTTSYEIAIYEDYAKSNQLTIGDTLSILGRPFTITGYFYAPDHIMPAIRANQLNFDAQTQTLILAHVDDIYSLRRPFTVKYQGLGDFNALYDIEAFNVTDIVTSDLRSFGRNMQMIRAVLPRVYNMRITAISLETSTASVFSNIFLGVFSVLSLSLVALFMKRHIDTQKKDIEILSSLGYDRHRLAMGFILPGMVLSVMVLIGFGVGVVLSHQIFTDYAMRYQMPHAAFSIPISAVLIGLWLPITVLLIASYGYARWFLSRPSSMSTMTKRRMRFQQLKGWVSGCSLITMVTVLLLFSLFSRRIIDDFKEETLMGNHYENMVFLTRFTDLNRNLVEVFSSGTLKIVSVNQSLLSTPLSIQAYGLDETVSLKRLLHDDSLQNARLDQGFIITDQTARTYGLSVGDTLTLRVGQRLLTKSIVGIHSDLIESAVYLHRADLNYLFGFPDTYYNGYYTMQTDVKDDQAIRILSYHAIANEIETVLALSNRITLWLMSLATLLALFMFTLIIQNELQAKLPTFLTLKALGYNGVETFRIFFLHTIVTLGLSFLIGIGLVYGLMKIVLFLLQKELGFVFVVNYSFITVLFSFLIVSTLVLMVTVLVHHRSQKIPLSELLKQT